MKVYVIVWADGGSQHNEKVYKNKVDAEKYAAMDTLLLSVEEWEVEK